MALSKGRTEYIKNTYSNVSTNIIEITEDKLRNKLTMWKEKIIVSNAWIGVFGIDLSIIVAICTCEFKTTLGIDKNIIAAIFYILAIVFTLGFFYTAYKAYKQKDNIDVEKFIKDIEGEKEND